MKKTKTGTNGIFGVPLAYADCCEEQARYTLHSHISVWIENFNEVRNLLFHSSENIRNKARNELENYFHTIAQASLGDIFDFDKTSNCIPQPIHKINNVLIPPRDQDLRHMRHHVHCQNLHGVVGYYPSNGNICSPDQNGTAETINSKTAVEKIHILFWVEIALSIVLANIT